MLFNSFEFIIFFLPVTFLFYFLLNSRGLTFLSKIWLISCSLFFYSWWNIIYLPLIILSITINYIIGTLLSRNLNSNGETSYILKQKKTILFIGISFNILLLVFFKYTDFFIENFNAILNENYNLLNIALPLAISFFTFQQISFIVDSYRRECEKYSFFDYCLYVSFFPQLIAGPIVYHKDIMPQYHNTILKKINFENISKGIFIFSIGLFKKTIIADNLSLVVNSGFNSANALSFLEAWFVSLSYTFQLYFDFSGYTDMAIGAALLFNISLPINFNSPYKALNIQDFWRRWHITLSNFLKNYLYIPLGGNRKTPSRVYLNILITFFLGGIWHGAGWTFALWGLIHGFALVTHNIWKRTGIHINKFLSLIITFIFINATWVLFRAKDFKEALKVYSGMIGINGIDLPKTFRNIHFLELTNIRFNGILININSNFSYLLYWIAASFIIVIFMKNSTTLTEQYSPTLKWAFFTSILFLLGITSLTEVSEFLYFNF